MSDDRPQNTGSTKSFLTALVANAGLLGVEVAAFIILKRKLGRIYSPRTYLPPPDKRSKELPGGWWRWLPMTLRAPNTDIIHNNGLDAYMFLRFVKMMFNIFVVYTLFTFVVIIPIHIVGLPIDNGREIERISWTNIPANDGLLQVRFTSHVVVVYVMTFFIFWLIGREMSHFIHMRHEFLISPFHSRLAQARTVLITGVPEELANEHDIRQFASFVPGGVDRVWIYRDTRALNELFKRRQDVCSKLEAAEATLLRIAMKAWKLRVKAHKKGKNKHDVEKKIEEMDQPLLDELVPLTSRPKHRIGFWGLFGEKVDTIDWCTIEIAKLTTLIKTARTEAEGKFLGSVFIRCNLQLGAHVLAQCTSYHEPTKMSHKWMEVNPKDIVWRNLDDGALVMRGRAITSWIATVALIILWFFPAAAITTLSNLDELTAKVPWLRWINNAPNPVPGIVQGILPPLLLTILFAVLPFILKFLAWYENIPRWSLISISVYNRFFLFLLIHGFLNVTITRSITEIITDIVNNPTVAIQRLAEKIPLASIFFLTYMISQGLAGAGIALAQLIPMLLHFFRKFFLGRTPRQAYEVTFLMPMAELETLLPRLSLLATIGLAYSVLNPLINVLAFVSYGMFYMAYKLLFTQVFDQPDDRETGGLYFPMAISNLFVGLYIQQWTLAALFFLKSPNEQARPAALGQAIAMIVLFAITLIVQTHFQKSYNPITQYLPMSLATKKMAKRYEETRNRGGLTKLKKEKDEGDLDLFSKDNIKNLRRRIKKIPKKLDTKLGEIKDALTPSPSVVIRKSDDIELAALTSRSARASSEADYPLRDIHSNADRLPTIPDVQTPPANADIEGAADLFRTTTNDSKRSKKKPKSVKSKKSKESLTVADPAPAGIDLSDSEGDEEEEQDEHAFDHPSTYEEQKWIWIPKDTLGLSAELVRRLHEKGVDASDEGATMDVKGVVEVSRNPPDLQWTGGHDR